MKYPTAQCKKRHQCTFIGFFLSTFTNDLQKGEWSIDLNIRLLLVPPCYVRVLTKCVISDKHRNLGKISLSPKCLQSTHTNESSEHGDVTSQRDTLESDKQETE